ncbi:hypothetical protein DFJ74DRAFT_746386, partial [Hyaloraphidium curvatum]
DRVSDVIADTEKTQVLVYELLVLERWKSQIVPNLVLNLDGNEEAALKLRFVIQFEATLADFLSLILYHSFACSSLGSHATDLLRWCRRKMVNLLALGNEEGEGTSPSALERRMEKVDKDLAAAHHRHRHRISLSALAIVQCITDFASSLPLEATNLMLQADFDIVVLLIQLLESAPWLRLEKLLDEEFASNMVEASTKLTKYEAQTWMALYNLLLEPDVRRKYEIDAQRRGWIMQLRDILNGAVLKHLPHLRPLQAVVEEVSLLEPAEMKGARSKGLIQEITSVDRSLEESLKAEQADVHGIWFQTRDAAFQEYLER